MSLDFFASSFSKVLRYHPFQRVHRVIEGHQHIFFRNACILRRPLSLCSNIICCNYIQYIYNVHYSQNCSYNEEFFLNTKKIKKYFPQECGKDTQDLKKKNFDIWGFEKWMYLIKTDLLVTQTESFQGHFRFSQIQKVHI